jgi:hypothetical protein
MRDGFVCKHGKWNDQCEECYQDHLRSLGDHPSDKCSCEECIDRRVAAQAKAQVRQIGGSHYKDMPLQPEAFIYANGIGFHEGNAIKYLCRWRRKGGIIDLEKAIHLIELLIAHEREDAAVDAAKIGGE